MTLLDKHQRPYTVQVITGPQDLPPELVDAYANRFWTGSWRELLCIRGDEGTVLRQFGTIDPTTGQIYDDTAQILALEGIDPSTTPDWPQELWRRANAGSLHLDGQQLVPFWTEDDARRALTEFVGTPYNGRILLLRERETGACAGFSALTVTTSPLARLRFPIYERSDFPATDDPVVGVLLDHAICEPMRGRGLGSRLFDLRLSTLVDLGAEWIVGQTIKTEPAQFDGNYKKRGLREGTVHPTDSNKVLFVTSVDDLVPRCR